MMKTKAWVVSMFSVWCLLIPAFLSTARAEEWHFSAPPTAIRARELPEGLHAYERLVLDVRLKGETPPFPVLLSLFLETRDGVWVETREDLVLDGAAQTFDLSLKGRSVDWRVAKGDRLFGRDLLRNARRWGLRLYSPEPWEGTLDIGMLRTFPVRGDPIRPDFLPRELPETVSVGERVALKVEPVDWHDDPFAADTLPVFELGRGDDTWRVPAVWVQEYRSRRFPGRFEAERLPWRNPVFRGLWRPGAPGTVEVTMVWNGQRVPLGAIEVEEAPGETGSIPSPPSEPPAEFILTPKRPVWRSDASPDLWGPADVDRVWTPGLDWTGAWEMYAGPGEFNQARADALETWIAAARDPAPLRVATERVLDNRSRMNWKDHPWNADNGGTLTSPRELWTEARWTDLIVRRAVYLWGRYGAHPGVNGVYVDVARASDFHLAWIRDLRERLEEALPGVPVFCPSPGLPERRDRGRVAAPSDGWVKPEGLYGADRVEPGEEPIGVTLAGPSEQGFDVSLPMMQHWSDARVLEVVVEPHFAEDAFPVAQLQVRTAPDRLYEGPLLTLHNREINRVYVPLDDPEAWRETGEGNRPWTPLERMNVREILLRVYGVNDDPDAAFRIHDVRVVDPPAARVDEPPALAITEWTPPPARIRRMERMDWVFGLNRFFHNPYDPDEISVDVQITLPDGRRVTHPGFFHQHVRHTVEDAAERWELLPETDWRIRFRPWMEGVHAWKVVVRHRNGEDDETVLTRSGEVEALPNPDARGFVVQSESDPRFFEFQNGEFFYPVGHTMRSPTDRRPGIYQQELLDTLDEKDALGTETYAHWFQRMEETGGNFARIWVSNWWLGLEWNSRHTGYHGRKYFNQLNAARLDRVLALAEARGVYLNLETTNHGTFSSTIDGEWEKNPWSHYSPDEGPVKHASEFMVHEEGMEWHRHKLRYLIARAGHSPAVALWGVLTESEWTEAYFRSFRNPRKKNRKPWQPDPFRSKKYRQPFKEWTDRTARDLVEINAHPVVATTHFSNEGNGHDFWRLDSLRVMYNNAYTGFYRGHKPDVLELEKVQDPEKFAEYGKKGPWGGIVRDMSGYYAYFRRFAGDEKIVLLGEWGGRPTRNRDSHLVAEFHAGSWAAVMTSQAGVSGYWWFNLVDFYDLFDQYRAISTFMEGEDLRGMDYVTERWPVWFPGGEKRPARLALGKSTPEKAMVYVVSERLTRERNSRPPRRFGDPRFPSSGEGALAVPDQMRGGLYNAEFYNTFTGEIFQKDQVMLTDRQREVALPDHRVDLALKLIRQRDLTAAELRVVHPPPPTPTPVPTPTPLPTLAPTDGTDAPGTDEGTDTTAPAPDAPAPDAPALDAPAPDAPAPDAPAPDAPAPDAPTPDAPAPDAPAPDAPAPDAPAPDAPAPDAPAPDAPAPDAPAPDAPAPDAQALDAPAPDAPAPDAPAPDAPAPDAPAPDVPAPDAPAPDAPAPDAPAPDAPAPDAPAPDASAPDAPAPDAPAPDAPAPDASAPDAPAPDAPVPDSPPEDK